MDTEGLPLTRGTKSEIYKVASGEVINPQAVAEVPPTQEQPPVVEEVPPVIEQPVGKELRMEDIDILRNEPWLLGGTTKEA
jgi:hypothetical protein